MEEMVWFVWENYFCLIDFERPLKYFLKSKRKEGEHGTHLCEAIMRGWVKRASEELVHARGLISISS